MARVPDSRAEQAKNLFLQGKKLIEIAEILEIPEGTVRSWKKRYKWDDAVNATLQNPKRNVAKAKGGQPGNQNAAGHGGTGPPGNKNAVTTGEFETLLFDCLNEEEKQLAASVQLDKERLLLQEIQLLTVRERRMLKRIEAIKESVDSLDDSQSVKDMTLVSLKTGIEKDKETHLKEYHGKLGQIQSIEDALTRVQAQKRRAIESLHRFGFDDSRLQIELMKAELAMLKESGQETETGDDGFMAAMNAEAAEIWGGADG